jgi:hypothetical protein
MLASSLQLMGHLVSDSIPPGLEVEGHIPCVCITIAAMGQSLVNIAALKKDTNLDQAICHPSSVMVCAYHLGPFLILFPMSLASSPDLYVSDLDFPTVCLICEAESTLSWLPACCLDLSWLPSSQSLDPYVSHPTLPCGWGGSIYVSGFS